MNWGHGVVVFWLLILLGVYEFGGRQHLVMSELVSKNSGGQVWSEKTIFGSEKENSSG